MRIGTWLAAPLGGLMLFCALAVSACGISPGNTSDICTASPVRVVGKQPVIQPSPSQSGITAYLQSGKTIYAGQTTRIAWFVANDAAGPNLQVIAGINVEGNHFTKVVPKTNVSDGKSIYDSQIVFPKTGCWGVVATTGSTQGSFDLQVEASPHKAQ